MKRRKRRSHLKAGLLSLGAMAATASGATLHVDDSAPSGGDGSDFPHALQTIQAALALAGGGDEIRIGPGSYKPASQSTSIELANGVKIKGGYAGYGASNPDAYDPSTFVTTISGDLGGGTHAYHVVHASSSVGPPSFTSSTPYQDRANLSGVTVTGGAADGTGTNQNIGGGIFIEGGHPTIYNCRITGNEAEEAGGGIKCLGNATAPEIRDCRIDDNHSDDDGGGLDADRAVTVLTTTFHANTAGVSGGAVYMINQDDPSHDIEATFIDCRFFANEADGLASVSEGGGAMFIYDDGTFTMVNCLLAGNSAPYGYGGGLELCCAVTEIVNCTFVNNTAVSGGAIVDFNMALDCSVENSILWGNVATSSSFPDNFHVYGTALNFSYTTTAQSGISGTGVNHDDPEFIDPDGDDDELGTTDDNYRLPCGSPAIDTGHPDSANPSSSGGLPEDDFDADEDTYTTVEKTQDLDFQDRIVSYGGSAVDRGAYETQITSPCGSPQYADIAPRPCTDGQVNIDDLLTVLFTWGPCPPAASSCPGDISVDAYDVVNIDDLLAVINNWSGHCTIGSYDAGEFSSVEDCFEYCSEGYETYSDNWDACVNRCVSGLCEAQIIECD